MTSAGDANGSGPKTPTSISRHRSERERKIGHRRVGEGGEVTYKKVHIQSRCAEICVMITSLGYDNGTCDFNSEFSILKTILMATSVVMKMNISKRNKSP